MKKWISILLLLMLCTGICMNASAEENTVITFRGLPWGCSPAEAIQLLKDDLGEENLEVGTLRSSYFPYSITTHGNKNKLNMPMLFCCITVNNCKAAGYDIRAINLYFHPKISEDQQSFELSENAASLWKAEYSLSMPETISDNRVLINDMVGKLNSIYGEGDTEYVEWTSVSSSGKSTKSCRHHIWQDDENRIDVCSQIQGTMSVTYCQKSVFSTQTTINEIIQKEKEAKLQPIENPLDSSTDGL